MHADQLIAVKILCKATDAEELPWHPAIKKGQHRPDKQQGMEDIVTAVKGDDRTTDGDQNGCR